MKLLLLALFFLTPFSAFSQGITLSGTMHRTPIEGGCWYLQTSLNKRYELIGDSSLMRELRVEGQHVVVDAELLKNSASVCMIGPMARVLRRRDTIRYPVDPPIMTLTLDGTIHRLKSGVWYVKLPPFRGREQKFEFQTEPPFGSRHIGAHLHGSFRVIMSRASTRANMNGLILPNPTTEHQKRISIPQKFDPR